ncbi:MAG TPA: hypothetical protein VM052_02800 [Candidatus Limnocylindrales bacterium]|nr:hypothetical protein [Candidatus Limnocylindrales bacterium]
MHVSQVAFDRYVVELRPADADWRPLADPETLAETAMWLWEFGPTPLVAVVGHQGAAPPWLTGWSSRQITWSPEGAAVSDALVIETLADLERFLAEGAPHAHTMLMWPRISPAKTFEALEYHATEWKNAVDAIAAISHSGERFEVTQIA